METELDYEMRLVAIDRARLLSDRYDEIVPLEVLRMGFDFAGQRISFGDFFSGIFRPRQMHGPAALSLTTTPRKRARGAPYDDGLDEATNTGRHWTGDGRRPERARPLSRSSYSRALGCPPSAEADVRT